jgi:hypothetical protein
VLWPGGGWNTTVTSCELALCSVTFGSSVGEAPSAAGGSAATTAV